MGPLTLPHLVRCRASQHLDTSPYMAMSVLRSVQPQNRDYRAYLWPVRGIETGAGACEYDTFWIELLIKQHDPQDCENVYSGR